MWEASNVQRLFPSISPHAYSSHLPQVLSSLCISVSKQESGSSHSYYSSPIKSCLKTWSINHYPHEVQCSSQELSLNSSGFQHTNNKNINIKNWYLFFQLHLGIPLSNLFEYLNNYSKLLDIIPLGDQTYKKYQKQLNFCVPLPERINCRCIFEVWKTSVITEKHGPICIKHSQHLNEIVKLFFTTWILTYCDSFYNILDLLIILNWHVWTFKCWVWACSQVVNVYTCVGVEYIYHFSEFSKCFLWKDQ